MESDAIYTIVVNGKPEGPYTLETLKTFKILPGTFIKTPDMDDYKEAHAIPHLRALLGIQQMLTAPQYFAGFDLRLLAAIIDYFLVVMVFTFLALLSFIFIDNSASRIVAIGFGAPAIPLFKFLYGCYGDASAHQGTWGKQLVNIKVTDAYGQRIALGTSIWRNFAKIFSTLPVFFGYLYSFLNKKQQCFHDILAETLVVKDRLV